MNPACPACARETTLSGWDDVYGFECETCRAHVIRPNALEAFLARQVGSRGFREHLDRVRAAPASSRALQCPDCRANTYHLLRTERVEIDACAGCGGLFLDRGEALRYIEETRSVAPPGIKSGIRSRQELNDAIIRLMYELFF